MDDEDRAAILKRRKRFVAMAIGGLALGAAGCGDPQPCLEVAAPDSGIADTGIFDAATGVDASTDGGPMACLRFAPDSGEASDGGEPTDAQTPADAGDSGLPMPCLSFAS